MTSTSGEQRSAATYEATVKVREGSHVVATADITAPSEPRGTARVALRTPHRDAPGEARGELVDQVMDHPGVRDSDRVHVVAPLGDSAAMDRLRERTNNLDAHAAGASSIIDAEVPKPDADRQGDTP